MATPKQVRAAYKKIWFHLYHLQCALNEAHDKKIIQYDDYNKESPCFSLYDVQSRIESTTEKARAKALEDEVMKELKGVW